MPIMIAEHGRALDIARKYPRARVLDVTSKSPDGWVKLSPFYPHGGIPVPFSAGHFSQSVEGVWQALKVFEHVGVDPAMLGITTMSGLKRRGFRLGRILGHRQGLNGQNLLDYQTARRRIYLPTYRHVLEGPAAGLIRALRVLDTREELVVLLDFTTNGDVSDLSSPLSHAALIAQHIREEWPAEG